MTRRTRLCTVYLFAVVCMAGRDSVQHSVHAQEAAPADTIHLRFGWVPGMEARVATTRFQEQISGTRDTVAGSASYRLRVHPHASGLVIAYDDFAFPAPADTTEAAKLGSLGEQASAIVPKMVIDTTGSFLGIDDVASVRVRLDSVLTRMLEPEEAASAREMLEQVMTEDALEGLAAAEWNAIVGRWAGADLVPGAPYEFEETAALPMIPGAVVPMLSSFTLERRTSCTGSGTSQDCVEIRLVSRADSAAVQEVLAQFTAQLLATPGIGIGFESFTMENEMLLVTEPGTLRPHRVRMSKSMTGVFTAEGERGEVSRTEVRTYRYTY